MSGRTQASPTLVQLERTASAALLWLEETRLENLFDATPAARSAFCASWQQSFEQIKTIKLKRT